MLGSSYTLQGLALKNTYEDHLAENMHAMFEGAYKLNCKGLTGR